MTEKTITGIVSWLKGWFYDKTEITGFLNNKANQSDLNTTNGNLATLSSTVDNKVDKVNGKGLSTEDFTTALKDKLNGIESEANKIVVDSALSSTSENPLQNKAIYNELDGRAPIYHASSATTYGVGTTTNYGHVKTINGLTQSSHISGTALSAYQGKVLKDMIDAKSDFSGSYNDLTNVPSTFPPSSHTHSISSTDILIEGSYPNIDVSTGDKLITAFEGIDTALGNLSSIRAIEVVTVLPTPSASTLGKLYIINENSKVNVYYTEQSGTGSSDTYSWHKMDTDILDELSIDWSDITNKPSSFTPSPHNQSSNSIVEVGALTHIGTTANSDQHTINGAIDTAISTKGALTDDIDWTYNSNDFVNGIKLVPKASDNTGAITFHLKS